VTDIPFDRTGEWRLGALIKQGESLQGTLMPSAVVGPFDDVPTVGEAPPRIHTPTAEEVGGDLAKIDTRQPPDDMHSVDFADALGERPMVLLFATPALCVSRVCGPVVDIAEQVKHTDGEGVDFLHMEVFKDNKPSKSLKGLRPQLRAFNLPTEPWLFAINREGRIAAVLQGPFSVAELSEAVKRARG
jgi:hypothetical protein